MKKIFVAFSLIGFLSLLSCSTQKECRPRGSYVIHKKQIQPVSSELTDNTFSEENY